MSTKEELRNLALSYVSEVFRQKLDSVADSCAAKKDQAPGDEDITEDVKVKFEQTFANYLRYAYDFRLFFDAPFFMAPRDPKSADFSSFYLEF